MWRGRALLDRYRPAPVWRWTGDGQDVLAQLELLRVLCADVLGKKTGGGLPEDAIVRLVGQGLIPVAGEAPGDLVYGEAPDLGVVVERFEADFVAGSAYKAGRRAHVRSEELMHYCITEGSVLPAGQDL
jgi:hypothetical protein